MNYIIYLIEAILAVNILVIVHELGHMLAGRLFKVRSLRFVVGLGRRIFSFRFRGTDYCVGPVPLGGFVQLESGHTHETDRACMDCIAPWKRMLIYFAGPAANLFFVVVLFWAVYCAIGLKDREPVVAFVPPGSQAALAGIRPDDRILEINGKKITIWTQVISARERAEGEDLALLMGREPSYGETRKGFLKGPQNRWLVSLSPSALEEVQPTENRVRLRLGPVQAAERSVEKLVTLSKMLFQSTTGLMTAQVSPSELVGPIYLFHISAQTASVSQVSLVYLLATISACLFFFNLLPLPILDGGQILLTFLQKLLKRPLAPSSMRLLGHASLVWLVLLLASATLNDVVRLLGS